MDENLILEECGSLRILTPKDGYRLYNVKNNSYHSKIYLGKYDSVDNYRAIQVSLLENSEDNSLEGLKSKRIQLSKNNLSIYLENNPLFSTVKYEDGRYYNVTLEKQNLLLSNISTYQMSAQAGLPCLLTWNDTGNKCEVWAFEELFQLSLEIRNYVHPLVSLQQYMESQINLCTTIEEVAQVSVDFTKDVVNEFLPIYQKEFGLTKED